MMTTNLRSLVRSVAVLCVALGILLARPIASSATPSNDNFADATIVTSLPFSADLDTVGATDEAFEENLDRCDSAGPGVWFALKLTGELKEPNALLDGKTKMTATLFRGDDVESLQQVSCLRTFDGNDDGDGRQLSLESGDSYYIRVSNVDTTATGVDASIRLYESTGITGKLVGVDGAHLPGVVVTAYDTDKRRFAYGISYPSMNGTSSFRISALIPGETYRIKVGPGHRAAEDGESTSAPQYPADSYSEWYEDAESYADAEPITTEAAKDIRVSIVFGEASKPSVSATAEPSTEESGSATPTPSVTPSESSTELATSPVSSTGRGRPLWWIVLLVSLAVGTGLALKFRWFGRAKRSA
jgi:hypothetical protein